MRFRWILIASLLCCVMRTDLSALEEADQFDSSLGEGLKAADKRQVPVLVYFWATWCAPCKELEEVLEQEQVQKLLAGLACVRLNYDRERRHVRRFRVETLPTILVLDEKGAEITRWVGILPEEKFYQRLRNLKTGYPLYLSARERRVQTDLLTLGNYLLRCGNAAGAIREYQAALQPAPPDDQVTDQARLGLALGHFAEGNGETSRELLEWLTNEGTTARIREQARTFLSEIRRASSRNRSDGQNEDLGASP